MTARMSGDERRAQLLDIAREVFARQGYHGTAMDAVAEAAGITKPVLYQHFASKRELYLELLDDMRERLVYALDHVPPLARPEDLLAGGVRAFFEFVESDEAAFRLMFEAATADPEVAKRIQSVREEIADRTAHVVRSAGTGDSEAEIVAWAIVGMSEMVSHWWLDHPASRGTAEELAALVSQLAWHGLATS